MIFIEISTVTTARFDEEAERARIKQAFKAKKYKATREILLGLLDSFVAGDLADCYERFLQMDKETREYLDETMEQTIVSVHEQVMAAGRAVRRLNARTGEQESSRDEALSVQDVSRYSPRVSMTINGNAVATTVPSLKRIQQIVCN